jgi:putative flippase GtrA
MPKNNFFRYFIIGLSGALLDFLIFALLYKTFFLHEVIANLVGSFFGFNNNFFLNAFFNFKTKNNLLVRYFSYFSVCIFGIITSSIFIYLFVSILGFNAYLSKFFIMGFLFILQYSLNKKITFREINNN